MAAAHQLAEKHREHDAARSVAARFRRLLLKRVLFIGSAANAVGGIASIFAMLSSALRCEPNVSFLNVANPSSNWKGILSRRVGVWAVLARCCVLRRSGTVVFFSSAYNSF